MSEEWLIIRIFCPNCKKRITVGYADLDINYNTFSINTKCEYCNYKVELFYDRGEVMELINKGVK